jgi:hypothetical protein
MAHLVRLPANGVAQSSPLVVYLFGAGKYKIPAGKKLPEGTDNMGFTVRIDLRKVLLHQAALFFNISPQ